MRDYGLYDALANRASLFRIRRGQKSVLDNVFHSMTVKYFQSLVHSLDRILSRRRKSPGDLEHPERMTGESQQLRRGRQ